jgi:hypothetical protein
MSLTVNNLNRDSQNKSQITAVFESQYNYEIV